MQICVKVRIVGVFGHSSHMVFAHRTAFLVSLLTNIYLIILADFHSSLLALGTAVARFAVLLSLHDSNVETWK